MARLQELREAAERVVEVKNSPSVVIGGCVTAAPPKLSQTTRKAARAALSA